MVFSEALAATREFLEPGTLLLLGVDAETREDQIRFTVTRIEPLDAALDHKICKVEIDPAAGADVGALQALLAEGRARCQCN